MQYAVGESVGDWRGALRYFGVNPVAARKVKRGRNTHWIVRTKTGRVVLRLYGKGCTVAEVLYELTVLGHLKTRGWPVVTPVAEVLVTPVGVWCLFTYILGRRRTPRTQTGRYAEAYERGKLLARLHADLAPLASLGQREGWKTTPGGLFGRPGKPSARDVLSAFARKDPECARLLLAYHEQAALRLEGVGPGDAAVTVVHGDFTSWNMRYSRGRLVGLLDFDDTRLDLRVADFALSWRGVYGGVIDGYCDETPLSATERALITPVFWTFMVTCAVSGLEQGGTVDWAVKQLLRQPLPHSLGV